MAAKFKITRVPVYAATIQDKPGGLAAKLDPLAKAGANLDFLIARRVKATGKKKPKVPKGVLFVAPLKNAKQRAAAKKAGFKQSKSLHSLRVEGKNAKGLAGKIGAALGEAGINLRGISGAVTGGKCIIYLAFDKTADATKAAAAIKKL